MSIESKIKELNLKLPEPKNPVGSYVATKIVKNLLYISGQISINENGELIKGKVGKDLNVEEGDFFALLGPNGAGKTTTIGIISSLVNKTSGQVKHRVCL